jgi:tetratricopeptide (TPR) repeat protein
MAKQTTKVDTINAVDDATEYGGGIFRNVRVLGIIGAVLLVIAGGVYYYNYSRVANNERALLELSRVRPYYDRSEFAIAISGDPTKKFSGEPVRGLSAIVADYGSTPAGQIAALFLGNSYMATNQVDKAYEPYTQASEADADMIASAGHAGLAKVAESKSKNDEAAREYVKAASTDPLELNAPRFLLGAARNYELAGNKEEAIKNYRLVATKYPRAVDESNQARLALVRNNVEL